MPNSCQLKNSRTLCPLCGSLQIGIYFNDKKRDYYCCQVCYLVFVSKNYHLSPEQEKAEYDKHQNNPDDKGYQKFLSRTISPLLKYLSIKSSGLDFGCGPGPCISEMLKAHDIHVKNYDLYYCNNPAVLAEQYDFVTLTEVIEHISDAKSLLLQLKNLLKANGILAIMTKRVTDQQAFSSWHYKNDPTHICFYSVTTFEWIAEHYGWTLEIIDKDVIFFHNQ